MVYLFSSAPKTIETTLKSLELPYTLITKETFADFVVHMPVFGATDIGISYDFGKIFPDTLLENLKIVNIHFSLLPKYRGAVPVEAAILNGDKETGITFQWTDKKMDAGNILLMKKVSIPENYTAGELQKYLDSLLPDMLNELLGQEISNWQSKKQEGEPSYCYIKHLNRENAELYFDIESAEEIARKIRGFNPEPLAWTKIRFQGQETIMNILNGEIFPSEIASKTISWVKGRGMAIGTSSKSVLVTEMVISGKKLVKNGDILSLKGKIEIV